MINELDEELFEGKGKEIFEKHKPVMGLLNDERVFGVEIYKNKFKLYELCDTWFNIELTPEICNGLSSFFVDLSKYMEENKTV